MNEHIEIESAFFEFRKMKTFLEIGVTIYIPNIQYAPIDKAQEYVNSLLLIDLISVWDKAVNHFFNFHKLELIKGKSKPQILADAGHIKNPDHLHWYKSWRHETAHELARHDYSNLNQATDEVAKQFAAWGLLTGKLKFTRLWQEQPDGKWKVGARVGNIHILQYIVQSNQVPQGFSSSVGKSLDLSFDDFLKIAEPEINKENSIIYRDI